MVLFTVFGIRDNYKTLIFSTGKKNIKKGSIETSTLLFDGNIISGTLDQESKRGGTAILNIKDIDNLNIEISGKIKLKADGNTEEFSFKANETILGAGNSHIDIKGDEA